MTSTTIATRPTDCDRSTAVTRALLGYGVLAGPAYVLVSVAQALTRDGFDLTRHSWSLLANGPYGWIQATNLVLTGLMVVAFAVGLRRALRSGRGATWAPRLVACYGAGLVVAGIFRADPALGFPVGTPADAKTISWHGALHLTAAGVGFLCLTVACLVLGRRFAGEGRRSWAVFSRITGVFFIAAFAGIASGSAGPVTTLPFVAAVVLVSAWISATAAHLYNHTVPPAGR